MSRPSLSALETDSRDLAAALHLVAAGAAQRGDDDTHRTLRLLARHAEGIVEQVERLEEANAPTGA